MASRKDLKKHIYVIADALFLASACEGVNSTVVSNSLCNVLNLIPRISHTEPGNVKAYYRQLRQSVQDELQKVIAELQN